MKKSLILLLAVTICITAWTCPNIDTLKIKGPIAIRFDKHNITFSVDSIPGCSYYMGATPVTGSEIPFININSHTCQITSIPSDCLMFLVYAIAKDTCDNSKTIQQFVYVDTVVSRKIELIRLPLGKPVPTNMCAGADSLKFCVTPMHKPSTPFIAPIEIQASSDLQFISEGMGGTKTLIIPANAEGTYQIKATCLGFDPPIVLTWNITMDQKLKTIKPIEGKNKICKNSTQTFTAQFSNAKTFEWHWKSTKSKLNVNQLSFQTNKNDIFWDSLSGNEKLYFVGHNACNSDSISKDVFVQRPNPEPLGIASAFDDGRSRAFVAWNRTSNKGTSFYEVYREIETNIYRKIGKKRMDETAILIDDTSDVWKQAYTYKLRTYDTCGNYAESEPIRTMHLRITKQTDNHRLDWNRYISKATTEYIIYEVSPDFSRAAIGTVPASDGIQEFSFVINSPKPKAIYRVGYATPSIEPTKIKTDTGPFSQSFSNMSEASLVNIPFSPLPSVGISPNPAGLWTHIKSVPSANIVIQSLSGDILYSGKTDENGEATFSCALWARGAYLIKVFTQNASWNGPLVLQ